MLTGKGLYGFVLDAVNEKFRAAKYMSNKC